MKIIVIGCVEIGLNALKQVISDKWDVVAVFTLAKKYAGKTSGYVDFSTLTAKQGIQLYKIGKLNTPFNIQRIKKIQPDLIIICGWQTLVCEDILRIPGKGVIGFHSSLLPDYRGRAPVNWALINNEKKTGVTMFFCEKEPDTGAIIAQKSFPITLNDTCATVYQKASDATCELLNKYLPRIAGGEFVVYENDSKNAKFWPKRNPEDGKIDWDQNALDIHNWIRALTRPYPGAFTYYQGKKVFIWKSKYLSNFKKRKATTGTILRFSKLHNTARILVAAKDKPFYVWNITNERGVDITSKLKKGRFSNA